MEITLSGDILIDKITMPQTTFQKRRYGIRAGLTTISYSIAIFQIYNQAHILESLMSMLIFFICFHFLYLDLYKHPAKYMLRGILVLTLGEIALFGQNNRNLIGGIITINATIIFLAQNLHSNTKRSYKFSSLRYFWAGGGIFTIGIAIAYSFTTLGLYSNLPFTCQDLSKASTNIIDTFTSPLKLGRDEAKLAKENTQKFFTTTFGEAVSATETIQVESSLPQQQTLIDKIKTRKDTLITKTITENKTLNQGICDITLNKLEENLQKPGFQISVLVLMIVLILPFLRIIVQIISGIAILIFTLCYGVKIYRKYPITKEGEEIG